MNFKDALELIVAMNNDMKFRKQRSRGKLCAACAGPVGRSGGVSIYQPYQSEEAFVYLFCAICRRVDDDNDALHILIEAAELRLEHDKAGDYVVHQPGKLN